MKEMLGENTPPLVSFIIIAFNQEKYIAHALEAALAQNYEPLEIIVSDDCSIDGTYEIICSIAKKTNRNIILNRNKENLGIGSHINKVMNLAKGELVILAAGDDISMSDRTACLVDCWLKSNKSYDMIGSRYVLMDLHGRIGRSVDHIDESMLTDVEIAKSGNCILGATAAITQRMWKQFGELPSGSMHEDVIFSFRASMMGGIWVVKKDLVMYRQGSSTWLESRLSTTKEITLQNKVNIQKAYQASLWAMEDAIKVGRVDLINYIRCRSEKYKLMGDIYNRTGGLLKTCEAVFSREDRAMFFRLIIKSRIPLAHSLYRHLGAWGRRVLSWLSTNLNHSRSND